MLARINVLQSVSVMCLIISDSLLNINMVLIQTLSLLTSVLNPDIVLTQTHS